jgi:hypothetical protein
MLIQWPLSARVRRAEYDDKMLPRVWWVDLETPEQREKALAWDGSYVVRCLWSLRSGPGLPRRFGARTVEGVAAALGSWSWPGFKLGFERGQGSRCRARGSVNWGKMCSRARTGYNVRQHRGCCCKEALSRRSSRDVVRSPSDALPPRRRARGASRWKLGSRLR